MIIAADFNSLYTNLWNGGSQADLVDLILPNLYERRKKQKFVQSATLSHYKLRIKLSANTVLENFFPWLLSSHDWHTRDAHR